MLCKINGCRELTYGNERLCYYHKKQRDKLIPIGETHYFKSEYEIDCATGNRQPNWNLAIKELPRIKRVCNNVLKWARYPIRELIQESLILVATIDVKKHKYRHYLNLSLQGMLKNFIAEFRNVVSYYWKPFFQSINDRVMDESMSLLDYDDTNPEDLLIEQEQCIITKDHIRQFKQQLSKAERVIFDYRLMRQKPIPLRVLEQKLNVSKSTIQRWEQELKQEFRKFIDG